MVRSPDLFSTTTKKNGKKWSGHVRLMLRLEFLERTNKYGPIYGFMMSPQPIRPYHFGISPSSTPNTTCLSLMTNSLDYSILARSLTPSSLLNSNESITPANNPQSPKTIVTSDEPITSTSVTLMSPTTIDKGKYASTFNRSC